MSQKRRAAATQGLGEQRHADGKRRRGQHTRPFPDTRQRARDTRAHGLLFPGCAGAALCTYAIQAPCVLCCSFFLTCHFLNALQAPCPLLCYFSILWHFLSTLQAPRPLLCYFSILPCLVCYFSILSDLCSVTVCQMNILRRGHMDPTYT